MRDVKRGKRDERRRTRDEGTGKEGRWTKKKKREG